MNSKIKQSLGVIHQLKEKVVINSNKFNVNLQENSFRHNLDSIANDRLIVNYFCNNHVIIFEF